jgi:hypothetical protein
MHSLFIVEFAGAEKAKFKESCFFREFAATNLLVVILSVSRTLRVHYMFLSPKETSFMSFPL